MGWVDDIAQLYHLNCLRLQAPADSAQRAVQQDRLQQAVQHMAQQRDRGLADGRLAEPASAGLRSMATHWSGLTVFVEHAQVPMDNNVAERDARLAVVDCQEFLWLRLAVLRPIGRHPVQPAHDGQAVGAQRPHLAECLSASVWR